MRVLWSVKVAGTTIPAGGMLAFIGIGLVKRQHKNNFFLSRQNYSMMKMSSYQVAIQPAINYQPEAGPLDNYIQLSSKDSPKEDLKSQNKQVGSLIARRNSKAISKAINGRLLYLNSPIHNDYQRSYNCSENMKQTGNRFNSFTCMKRSCIVCARIQAAKMFKQYSKPLMELPELHLVTLTAPTVNEDELKAEIGKRYKCIVSITKQLQMRKNSIKLRGIRKLEVTYNFRTGRYHPHYHILISGKEAAEEVKKLWLKKIPEADAKAQDVRPIYSEGALMEVFKYVTKQVVKNSYNSRVLDGMYCAIKGVRVIQPFGIKKVPVSKKAEDVVVHHKGERIDVWKWCNDRHDWYTQEGEQLNEGELKPKTKKALKLIQNEERREQAKDEERSQEGIPKDGSGCKEESIDDSQDRVKAIMRKHLFNVARSPVSGSIPIEFHFN